MHGRRFGPPIPIPTADLRLRDLAAPSANALSRARHRHARRKSPSCLIIYPFDGAHNLGVGHRVVLRSKAVRTDLTESVPAIYSAAHNSSYVSSRALLFHPFIRHPRVSRAGIITQATVCRHFREMNSTLFTASHPFLLPFSPQRYGIDKFLIGGHRDAHVIARIIRSRSTSYRRKRVTSSIVTRFPVSVRTESSCSARTPRQLTIEFRRVPS